MGRDEAAAAESLIILIGSRIPMLVCHSGKNVKLRGVGGVFYVKRGGLLHWNIITSSCNWDGSLGALGLRTNCYFSSKCLYLLPLVVLREE